MNENETVTLNILTSNNKIIELINSNKPFSIVRLGAAISSCSVKYINKNEYTSSEKTRVSELDGIYYTDLDQLNDYCTYYNNAIKNSDLFSCFPSLYTIQQNFYINHYMINQNKIIHNRSLEPFYILESDSNNCIPWTHVLSNKKVLVINSFVDLFKSRWKDIYFYNKSGGRVNLWNKDQNFIYYKSYNSLAGNHPHSDWKETFTIMCNDIEKIDFDIAILACGGYGILLCDWIKNKLNKGAIYVGGGLPLLFGVYGKRWINHPIISKLINEKDSKWIRPSATIENYKKVEDGCYW